VARPLVTLHFAQSLDGRLGLGRERDRAVLSSEEGMLCAHRARREHDSVLIGIETSLHDDPRLTARGEGSSQPLRVVLDSELRLPLRARLFDSERDAGQVIVFGTAERASAERRRALELAGAEVKLTRADQQGRVSLPEVLELLSGQGVKRLLVEGGSKVLTSFLREQLADRAELEIAPYFLGAPGTPVLGELGITSLTRALRLERLETEQLGASICLRGDIVYPTRSG
jgi:riboflavin-specific deaminase-like protein